ncbi:MAG: Adaptive-response sensory-kinase SasA [Phycisphaerae bacterium]|nr:Adaptive-response sensory-kinase SasA [Phycisphaerae bacterium]
MLLRHKFGLLALVYVTAIAVTLVVALACIVVYFDAALERAHAAVALRDEVETLRTLARAYEGVGWGADDAAAREGLARSWRERSARLASRLQEGSLTAAWSDVARAASPIFAEGSGGGEPDAAGRSADLDRALAALLRRLGDEGAEQVSAAGRTQQRVVSLLVINGVAAAALCVAGLVLVHRWIQRPILELRDATRRIAGGDFNGRIVVRSRDELGRLADEINQMCGMITAMQARLAEQERLAGAAEMLMRVAHNIRNPLQGLRGLAEETIHRHADDAQTRDLQQRILGTVDRFERWLRELHHATSPGTIHPGPVALEPWLRNVAEVLSPMARKRGATLEVRVAPELDWVVMDSAQMEQALVALLTNALQASSSGGCVRATARLGSEAQRWELEVSDEGPGIPESLREAVFQPYFTTKADGYGLGLAMARQIVRLHGGEVGVAPSAGTGGRIVATLPRHAASGASA